MAVINSKTLFLTTSPRTPEKMVPEIELLIRHFEGRKWNLTTQREYMKVLREENFFNGKGANDPAFSARDRINRAPKALGFVDVSDKIKLTPAGAALLNSRRKEEVFLRQMLKFQIPSPFHKLGNKSSDFCIKPYLEILRLVRTLGTISFDELMIFGMQLTRWQDFNYIVEKIDKFRLAKINNQGSYRNFKGGYFAQEIQKIYHTRISTGETKTRESNDKTLKKFLKTKASNMRDYADACFRYLRATGLVNVSHVGKSLSIAPERIADVDHILATVDRNPVVFQSKEKYIAYLGNVNTPALLTDNKKELLKRLHKEFPQVSINSSSNIQTLKELLTNLTQQRKNESIEKQIADIKDYKLYNEIQKTFEQIKNNELYDAPLMLEWNTWRAMTMLDGGKIHANLHFDDFGFPLSNAQGNVADIICDYEDFFLTVEVTMANGQRQYEMEGEPVSRHVGKLKTTTRKPCYSLFLAPKINEACLAHFYALLSINISYYGGKSTIIPLPLHIFQKMLEDSYKASSTPNSEKVKRFFTHCAELAEKSENEKDWFNKITYVASNWLNA